MNDLKDPNLFLVPLLEYSVSAAPFPIPSLMKQFWKQTFFGVKLLIFSSKFLISFIYSKSKAFYNKNVFSPKMFSRGGKMSKQIFTLFFSFAFLCIFNLFKMLFSRILKIHLFNFNQN